MITSFQNKSKNKHHQTQLLRTDPAFFCPVSSCASGLPNSDEAKLLSITLMTKTHFLAYAMPTGIHIEHSEDLMKHNFYFLFLCEEENRGLFFCQKVWYNCVNME